MADMEAMDKLRHERIQNFKNVITGKGKIDHIPYFANYFSWKYFDAGYKLSEALYDYDKMYDAIDQFLGRYNVDVLHETGWRNPVQATSILGNENDYIIDDETYSLSIKDQVYMDDGDYEKLIADPKKYLWETFLPRKFSVLKNGDSSVSFQKFFDKYKEFGGFLGKVGALTLSHGSAGFFAPNGPVENFAFGYELLFCSMRGMKNLAIDLRRRPDQVAAACEALNEVFVWPRFERAYAEQKNGTDPEFCVDVNPVLLGHVIMNPKQFEKYYWPYLEKIGKYAEDKDKLVYIFAEGASKRFWDFFRQLPENRFAIHTELDDVFEMKKALPNCVVAGGMPSSLLGRATPEECVAYAKRLIEEVGGEDHRYIFSEDKMMSFPADCKRENLLAVTEYVNSVKF